MKKIKINLNEIRNPFYKIKKFTTPKQYKNFQSLKNALLLDESVLDPLHKTLCKEVWETEDKIKSDVRDFIINKINNWASQLNLPKPERIQIVGSITTYNYSDTSDIDVNFTIPGIEDEKRQKLVEILPNNYSLLDTSHPVNYYFLNPEKAEEDEKKKETIYDLTNDKWIKEPKKNDANIPHNYVLEISKFFMTGIDDRIAEYRRDFLDYKLFKKYLNDTEIESDKEDIEKMIELKKSEIESDLESLYVALKMVKAFRSDAYDEERKDFYKFAIKINDENPDYSLNNLVYKTMERFGYLERLEKFKKKRDKWLNKKENKEE